MYNFKNKTVLVTGSSRGIGKATALLFAEYGSNVVINYLNSKEEAEDLCIQIKNKGVECLAIQCDVSKEQEVQSMFNKIGKKFSKIDFLVNNAGGVLEKNILEKTSEDWMITLSTNLISQHLCIKYAQKMMPEGSKIVNISSTSAIYTFDPNIADYDSAKAGVIALTKNYAITLAPNILVNCVIPGWINTDINLNLSNDLVKKETEQIYMKRFGEPSEVAKVISFLCSDDASFITGASILVNGGHD